MVIDRRARANELLADSVDEAVAWDGLDSAIVGVGSQYPKPPLVAYSRRLLVEAVMAMDAETTREDAEEYVSFNIAQAYVGEGTPIILDLVDDDDA